ncbi:PREDICTED: uncharacterized protein LOC109331794 isoform X1 [Lupinus angustifolius]|nr:PREDICTED: uncharacterized protein LOC109331794 isoform X1 [Lupinus angustifolius]
MNCSTLFLCSSPLPLFKPKHSLINSSSSSSSLKLKSTQKCRAVLIDDAPFTAAIGACMLTSLIFPVVEDDDDDDSTTDTRLAVMAILTFVPYFNWLSWVFAWFDTGNRRYAVYSIVYLLPYLRTNLSLSPEESWLPIASILLCIVHIQLEASIRNGDIQGFQLFKNQSSSITGKKGNLNQQQEIFNEGSKKEKKNLLSAQDQSRNVSDWDDSQKPLRQRLNEDLDDDGGEERSEH